ncbi:phage tail tape measure protein [Paraburkholderia atlantica]|uniref:phage tail tape measure protein n=1 Tax=Paraburkholderia atlantica TaxID=2654982 RepID=UPI00036C36D8|nr:phage tail tape measure protein [Paraburkholderia atlantica]
MADSQLKAELTADASQFSVEMAKAVKANQDFMTAERLKAEVVRAQERAVQEAQTAAAATGETVATQTVSQINRQVKALVEQAQRVEYGTTAIRAMRAEQLGISASTQQFRDALAQSATSAERLGHSSAGARKEVLVLAHEAATGSWSNFGGSLLVLGERIDAMKYLLNPVALGLSAVGIAAYGAYSAIHGASEEFKKFNESLTLTNNWAGLTNDTAATLAKTIAGDLGTSFAAARDAVNATSASGKVLGTDMQTVTELALLMAKSTGESFDKALDSLIKQQNGVSAAADEWQSAHHDMDAATLEHIKSLDKAGEHTTALRILYEQELKTMKSGTDTQVGAMTKLWNGFLDGFGRYRRELAGTSSKEDQLAELQSQLNAPPTAANNYGMDKPQLQARIDAIKAEIAAQQRNKAATDAVTAAKAQLDELDTRANKILEDNATSEQKRTKAINEANAAYVKRVALAKTAGIYTPALDAKFASQRDVEISDARSKFKDPKPEHAKSVTDDAATRDLQAASQTHAALQAQLDAREKIGTETEKLLKFEQQIADLKTKKTLTADQKSLLAHQSEIDAALKQNAELEKQVQAQQALNKLKAAAASIDADIASYQQSQAEQYERQLTAIGMGSDAQKQAAAVKSIYAKYQQEQEKLNKAARETGMSNDVYRDESAKIQAGLQTSLKAYTDYYAELKAKQGDWVNGLTAGWADYVSEAEDKMKQTERVVGDVTNGMEDAWVSFVQTGKISFTSLANSIIADLARMSAKAAISGFFSSAVSYASSFFGGGSTASSALASGTTSGINSYGFTLPAHADGGFITGPGTGTSDSIVARLSNGEGVLTAETVSRLGGERAIDALNNGGSIDHLQRFATGGVVGATTSVTPMARGGDTNVNVDVTAGGSSLDQSDVSWLQSQIKALVDSRLAQKMKGQGGYAWQQKYGSVG